MALTFTKIQESVQGNVRTWVGTLTFDATYVSGGMAYTPANFGMQNTPTHISLDNPLGFSFYNDRANRKIIAYSASSTEVAGGASLATVVLNARAEGI